MLVKVEEGVDIPTSLGPLPVVQMKDARWRRQLHFLCCEDDWWLSLPYLGKLSWWRSTVNFTRDLWDLVLVIQKMFIQSCEDLHKVYKRPSHVFVMCVNVWAMTYIKSLTITIIAPFIFKLFFVVHSYFNRNPDFQLNSASKLSHLF